MAYHRVLFAVGNDHRGSYFPIVLDAVAYLVEILALGTPLARARALDVLIDLVGSFGPDAEVVAKDGLSPEELPRLLRRRVESARPILENMMADPSVPELQKLAGELVECLT